MGTSTNAVLFYGYAWEDEKSNPWDDEDMDDEERDNAGWEERYAFRMGVKPPSRPYPEREVPRTRENGWDSTPKDYTPEEQGIIDEYCAFWKKQRELAAESPVEVGSHCSCECPMPYVCIRASEVTAHRGDAIEIKSLEAKPEWDAQLKDFCKLMGIKVGNKKPRWWLVSMWC